MTSVLFKTDFEGDIRRMSLPEASFAKLKNVLSELYGLSDFSLKYTDEDNELITIASDLEAGLLFWRVHFACASSSFCSLMRSLSVSLVRWLLR